MKLSRQLSVKTLGAILLALIWTGTSFAGSGPEPPAGATITGPEIWGVVVLDCNAGRGTARVKRVVDCNTETEAKSGIWSVDTQNCPTGVADVEGFSMPITSPTFFGITGTAFVNKAKNFENVGGVVSFDAQFKFWQ